MYITVSTRCKDCCKYKPISKSQGKCVASKRGSGIKQGSSYSCKRFEAGTYNPELMEHTDEEKLDIIMNTIADCYKGGKWG